jgi:hypothetical protein
MPRRLSLLVLFCSVALGSLAVSCSSGDDSSESTATTNDPTAVSLSPEESIALEEELELTTPEDEFQIGQTLRLTDAGPTPSTLVVIVDRELTVRNDSSQPQTMTFASDIDAEGRTSVGPLAPGEETIVVPFRPVSMAYRLGTDPAAEIAGVLQVDTGDFDG